MKELKIGILDFSKLSSSLKKKSSPEIRLLRESIKEQGHTPLIYRVDRCELFFNHDKCELLYNNMPLKGCDVLIPRVSAVHNIDLEISIVKQFQMLDIKLLNEYLPICRAKNKLRTLQILTHAGIPVPMTIVVRKLEFLDRGIELVGGFPVIIKHPFQSKFAIAESRRSLYSALDFIWGSLSRVLLIQEYVSEATEGHFKALVLGDKILSCVQDKIDEMHFNNDDANTDSLEDKPSTLVDITPQERQLAVKAVKVLGLEFASVEFLRTTHGPLFMGVNANPSFKDLTEMTGIDIAGRVIKHCVKKANHKQINGNNLLMHPSEVVAIDSH